jgi:hypothetical protein
MHADVVGPEKVLQWANSAVGPVGCDEVRC